MKTWKGRFSWLTLIGRENMCSLDPVVFVICSPDIPCVSLFLFSSSKNKFILASPRCPVSNK